MLRAILTVGVVTLSVTLAVSAVMAQNDPIATRKATMKGVGEARAEINKFAKGEAPFKLETVQIALAKYQAAAKLMPTLFPDNSKTGGETAALPKIWENKTDFEARWAKLGVDAAAASASIKDEASFKEQFPAVTKNCDGCHENNRAKKG